MNIQTFDLERFQSLYENTVKYNLTESGFHPFTLQELLTPEQIEVLCNTTLGYGQTNGSIELRRTIASLYPSQTEDNILVTNGSAEANFVASHTLLSPGDQLVMMIPNYMQIWGIAEEMGVSCHPFHLLESSNWAPDLDELRRVVTDKARMIALCNPNNPTGYTLTEKEMMEIVNIADHVGAWVYCDEVYRGAELNFVETPSFTGMYDKVMVNGGLSKAYALPGLRLGWLAGPKKVIADSWSYHDYTSITAGILSHKIAEFALQPDLRHRILTRNREMLNENLQSVTQWIGDFKDTFLFIPPKAGGMAFMRYNMDINSTELMHWLRKEYDVFILAGDCYGMDNYFRIGIGAEKRYLMEGLALVAEALKKKFS